MKDKPGISIEIIVVITIMTAALTAYLPMSGNEFVGVFDDAQYLTTNYHVKTGISHNSIKWAFTTMYAGNWHPLTWISHMLDVTLFGMESSAHHFMNLLFHIINSLLVFILIKYAAGKQKTAAFIALLFAVHPLHVESVAWASERKDLLCTFFWLISIIFYIRYVKRKEVSSYMVSLLVFALSLMSKQMSVTQPFLLLILDFWPLKREGEFKNSKLKIFVYEKLPFLILSIACGLITIKAQSGAGAVASLTDVSLLPRIFIAAKAPFFYLWKMVLPVRLSCMYPFKVMGVYEGTAFIILFILAFAGSVMMWKKRPWITAGWLWFIVTLAPVSGILQTGGHSFADRYTYIPLCGVFMIIAFEAERLFHNKRKLKMFGYIITGIIVSILVFLTRLRVKDWKDSETLLRQALRVTEDNHFACSNLCTVYMNKGKIDKAEENIHRALDITRQYPYVHNNMGMLLMEKEEYDKALKSFHNALKLDPEFYKAHIHIAEIYLKTGKPELAVKHYKDARYIKKSNFKIWSNLGIIYSKMGNNNKALKCFTKAIEIENNRPGLIMNRIRVYLEMDSLSAAMNDISQVVKEYTEKNPVIILHTGKLLEEYGYIKEALNLYKKASEIDKKSEVIKSRIHVITKKIQ